MNNKNPLVSVIVTTYNRKELLKETIDSILNQTFKDFELIVVDNYSNYDFLSYMKSFNDSRIRAFQNQNDGIIAVNRNVGIKKAKGEYIAFCDDDDYWDKDKLSTQLSHFDTDIFIVGVGTCCKNIGATEYYRKSKKINSDIYIGFEDLFIFVSIALSSLMIRNNGLLFDESILYKYVEDFDFQVNLVLSTCGKIKLLEKALVYYRIHCRSNGIMNSDHNLLNVVEKYRTYLKKNLYKKTYYRYYFSLGIKALRLYDRDSSVYFLKSIRYCGYRNAKDIFKAFIGLIISTLPNIFIKRILFIYYYAK